MTTAALMQPSYIGWMGYFAMLDKADVFVLDDTAQYVRKSWHNRNRVRARDGNTIWLTVPVHGHRAPLNTIQIDNSQRWQRKHAATLQACYSHLPGWPLLEETLHEAYTEQWDRLTAFTANMIETLAYTLGITTPIVRASDLGPTRPGMADRITDLCHAVNADVLLNTPTASAYLNDTMLQDIHIEWFNYNHPVYTQGEHEWQPYLSILDCLAYTTNDALAVIRAI